MHADPELHTDETQNEVISEENESDILGADFNASTGDIDAVEDAESIESFQMNENRATIGGYVTNNDGKAILVDGRPVLQEAMVDGSLRFQIIEDGNGVKGFCDGLAQTCVPSNLNKFSYKNPDDIPIVLMTYNQHKYDTEGVGQSAYENTESDPQPIQSEISADLTQNVPGTTEPSMREECKNAAKSGASLPSLSSGCIDAANPHLDAPIPSHCATDFLGPLSPSQDQTCSKHSEVRKSAESHEFLFNKPASSKAKNSDDEETEVKDTDQTVSDDKSKDAAENDADIVGNDAEEALKKVEDAAKNAPEKGANELESFQESSANESAGVDESVGLGMESLDPTTIPNESAENIENTTPEDMKLLYGDDDVSADEDDSMGDNVNNEDLGNGGFFENNSDWFNDDGTLTDPDDFENKAADEDELSNMEDLLGLTDLAKDAGQEKEAQSLEVLQENASPTTGDVRIDAESSSQENENLDVESLKINLNAVDEDIDAKKQKLSVIDEKTGVKIVETKDGFIAQTFSIKSNPESQNKDDEVKLISKMNKEELMDRFNLSEDELEDKLQKCKEINPSTKDSDCLKEDATLFGDLLIKQD